MPGPAEYVYPNPHGDERALRIVTILAALLLCFPLLCFLQCVSGRTTVQVRDAQGAPIADATVVLDGSSTVRSTAMTDRKGEACIAADAGTYLLEVTFAGLAPYSREVTVTGERQELRIWLRPTTTASIEVQAGSEETALDISSPTTVLLSRFLTIYATVGAALAGSCMRT